MAFIVRYRGLDVHCETLEDLDTLADQVAGKRHASGPQRIKPLTAIGSDSVSEPTLSQMLKTLKKSQRQLLSRLASAENVVSDTQLREALSLSGNKALAGVLSGISKAAKRVGAAGSPIVRSVSRDSKGEREYFYALSPEDAEEVRQALRL